MYHSLLASVENCIYTITINRPEKLNALNWEVLNELNHALDIVESNTDIHSVIITGSGEKAFVAGADIAEFTGLSAEEGRALSKRGQEIFFRIENCSKPIIACVNGFALGGGLELAMSCHIIFASSNAKFGQPEINLGLLPGYGGTQRLTKLVGKGRAIEMILTGEMIDSAAALAYGLVNKVVDQSDLLKEANNLLERINLKSSIVIKEVLKAINFADESNNIGYAVEIESFSKCFTFNDSKEGINAFLQKRKPNFKGD